MKEDVYVEDLKKRYSQLVFAAIISCLLNLILMAALINEQRLYRAAVAEANLLRFDAMRSDRQLSACQDEKGRLRRGEIE